MKEMRDASVNLIVLKGSVANTKDIERLKEVTREKPIRGIVQGAMVLQVSLLQAVDMNTN